MRTRAKTVEIFRSTRACVCSATNSVCRAVLHVVARISLTCDVHTHDCGPNMDAKSKNASKDAATRLINTRKMIRYCRSKKLWDIDNRTVMFPVKNCCKSADVWQQERHCRQRQIRDQLAAHNLDVSTRSTVRSPFCLLQSRPSMNAHSCRSLSEEGRWD